jgi:hypothetical protein
MIGQGKNQAFYNQKAVEWVDEFMKNNEPLIDFISFDGHIIHNSHYTLELWKTRLLNNKGAEERAAFIRIKKFKDWYNGTYKI